MRVWAGICLAFLATPVAAEAVYTKGAVQVVAQGALEPNEKRGLSAFKSRARDFHGALYVSSGGDHAEWWVDEHRLDDAKTIAKANCEANDGAQGACTLYAVIVPAGNATGSGKVAGNINASLSRAMAQAFRKGGAGSHGAAAANRVAKFGVSWGHPSREAARKDALLTCLQSIERGGGADVFSQYVTAQTYNRLLSGGRFDCKVVADFRR